MKKNVIPVYVAPMAGISNGAFRTIALEMGADFVFTEMVNARGVLAVNPKTREIVDIDKKERAVGIQIFGSKPATMAEAAQLLTNEYQISHININMGCPVPKVVKGGMGAALMKDIDLAGEIVAEVAKRICGTVSVKMRSGWQEKEINAVELAQVCQDAGAGLLIVHGRTREQFYTGKADWNVIKKVKKAVKIPVIGNGDIFFPTDAVSMLQLTGCDGVMVARGALGNPWLIKGIKSLLAGRKTERPTLRERFAMILYHYELLSKLRKNSKRTVSEMRKHIGWYIKGLPEARQARQRIFELNDLPAIFNFLKEYEKSLIGID